MGNAGLAKERGDQGNLSRYNTRPAPVTLRSSYLKEQLPVAMTTLPELPTRVENAQHFAELVSNDPEA